VPRSLIVNADDLGLTKGVNAGIFEAHDRGILTSASLFANAPATADAIRRAHTRPSLGVGCHLTLVDGQPTLSPHRVPTLIADDGRFRKSWKPFIVACLRGRVSLGEVERELTAQIDRLRSDGITLTHLDAHKHVHAFPPLFAIVARIAERFRIPVVRVPFERWSPFGSELLRHRIARRQGLLNLAMWPWARRDRLIAAAHGLSVPTFVGRIHTGALSARVLKRTVRSLGSGVTELMVHPGYVDDELSMTSTRLLISRAEEVQLLCGTEMRDLIIEENIDLVRHDLIKTIKRSFSYAS
jgi:predicted glycoside hydrolase/deacetylase ChbG (UPF0249 family)